MKLSKLLVGAFMIGVVSGGVVWAQNSTLVFKQGKEKASAVNPLMSLKIDPLVEIRGEIAELRAQDVSQKAEIARLRTQLAETNTRIGQLNAAPKGYATTYITKFNWDNLPGTTLLKVWSRL